MHYILYVALHGFYTRVLQPDSTDTPLVVTHQNIVLDASPSAQRLGVGVGSAVSEAKAILRNEGKFVAFEQDQYKVARDTWLDICLGYSDKIEPGMPHEAYVDLSSHPRPSEIASLLIRQLGVQVTAGIAPAKWVAKLASRPISDTPKLRGISLVEPVRDVGAFLHNVPTSLLTPVPSEHRSRLEFLGYRWAKEVAQASLGVLLGQFGRDAFLIQETAQGRAMDLVSPSYPSSSLTDRIAFDCPVNDRLIVQEAITSVSLALAKELCSLDKTAEEVLLCFEDEEGIPHVVRRKLAKSVQAANPLRVALCALWQSTLKEIAPVALKVTLIGLNKAPRGQKALFGFAGSSERSRACEVAMGSLQAAFGNGVVQKATDMTLPRRELVLRVWKRATGWN